MEKKKKFVLLVVPSFENAYHSFRYFAGILPHLGLTIIAGIVEKLGYDVKIIDSDAEGLDFKTALDRVVAEAPYYVGSTTMSAVMDITGEFYAALKVRLPSVTVIVGGPHVSSIPEHTLNQFDSIDFGVIGEGDHVIGELLSTLERRGDPGTVKGIVYRKDGQVVLTEDRPAIPDLAHTVMPAYHLLNFNLYRAYGFHGWADGERKPLGVMATSRGCYGKCNFCAAHNVFGPGVRFYPMEMIKRQLDVLVNDYKVKIINFIDDTFTFNRRQVNEICDYIIEKGYHKRVQSMVGARVDVIHIPTLIKMRRANFTWIGFGVESGSQPILDRMKKRISLDQIRHAFKVTNDMGFYVTGNFMIGHLGETWETAMDTINLACELEQDYTSVAIAIPFPGTELYDHCIEKGIKLPSWNDFGNVNSPPTPLNDTLSADELMNLRMIFLNKFFKRRSFLTRILTRFNAPIVLRDLSYMYLAVRKESKEGRF